MREQIAFYSTGTEIFPHGRQRQGRQRLHHPNEALHEDYKSESVKVRKSKVNNSHSPRILKQERMIADRQESYLQENKF